MPEPRRRARRRRRRPRPPRRTEPSSSSTPVTRPSSVTQRRAARPRRTLDGLAAARRPAGAGRSSGRPRRRARAARSARARARRGAPGSGAAARRRRPSDSRNAISRSSASASSASRATTSVPERAQARVLAGGLGELGAEALEHARRCAARARAARARRTPPPRPGASMPAATCQAPGSPRRSRSARRPRRAARQAHARPIGPPPMTATSGESCAGATGGGSLPTPVRPGSGSTVGGPRAALSARSRAPVMDLPILECARSMTPRERIAGARLYLVCDARPREFLAAAIRGGVDVIQLRDKALGDEALVTAAREFRAAADAGGALFVLNDRPGPGGGLRGRRRPRRPGRRLARRGARGRRAGRDRRALDARAGRSATPRTPTPTWTTSPSARCTRRRPSPAGPPPAWTTSPTRRRTRDKPWFAIGGLDAGNVAEVDRARRDAGGRRAGDHGVRRPGVRRGGAAGRAGGPPWASAAVRPGPAPAAPGGRGPRLRALPAAQRGGARRSSSRSRPASARARSRSPR